MLPTLPSWWSPTSFFLPSVARIDGMRPSSVQKQMKQIHFAVHLTITQHCKSTILQWRFKRKKKRSKGKLYSFIKERRDTSSTSIVWALSLEGSRRGCFTGISSEGRGRGSGVRGGAVLLTLPTSEPVSHAVSVGGPPPPSWSAGAAFSLSEAPRARPLLAAPCEQVKLDEAQRKRNKKVRLYFITHILFLFSRNC